MLGGAQEGALAGTQGNPGGDDCGHHRRGHRGTLLGVGRLPAVPDHPTGPELMAEDEGRKWYVVHTYSGYEHKVKAALEERVRSLGKPDLFGSILVPSEKVVELVKGKKKTSSRKFFPGYILVNMRLNNETWHIVKSTPKVTGFLGGGMDPRSIPPISGGAVREITHQMEGGAGQSQPAGRTRPRPARRQHHGVLQGLQRPDSGADRADHPRHHHRIRGPVVHVRHQDPSCRRAAQARGRHREGIGRGGQEEGGPGDPATGGRDREAQDARPHCGRPRGRRPDGRGHRAQPRARGRVTDSRGDEPWRRKASGIGQQPPRSSGRGAIPWKRPFGPSRRATVKPSSTRLWSLPSSSGSIRARQTRTC